MSNISFAVLAAAQPARIGVSPLSATRRGAGGVSLPAALLDVAASTKRPRPAGFFTAGSWPLALTTVTNKPGHTNIRNQHTNMTRVYADGEGGSGPQPLRKPA